MKEDERFIKEKMGKEEEITKKEREMRESNKKYERWETSVAWREKAIPLGERGDCKKIVNFRFKINEWLRFVYEI